MSTAQIIELALALPEEERASVVQTLWESLDASHYPVSDEFLSELERRDQEMTDGKVTGNSHEAVMAKARQALE